MSIGIVCSGCGKHYQVPDDSAGKKAHCKACGNKMVIPAIPANPTISNDLWNELSTAQPPAPQSAPPPDAAASARETRSPFPTRRRKPATWQVFESDKWTTVVVFLIVGGGILIFIGQREWRLASRSKPIPQQITLANLMANGPGDNIHLDLFDCRLLPEHSVIEKEGTKGTNQDHWRWKYAWIPAVPLQQVGQPNILQIKVVIGTKDCTNDNELINFCRQTKFQGIIVNSTDSLKSKEVQLLNDGLPGVDVASCYLFRAGQHPVSGGIQALLLGGGTLLLIAGLVPVAFYLKQKFAG
jgi:hypothetical protein